MDIVRMSFDGRLLRRGFWLYVWDIREQGRQHLYVGRTGDTASPYASSPFRRIGQHLDTKLNAKGNALGRRLKAACIQPETCTFEMTAVGPFYPEQPDMEHHRPVMVRTAALERLLADELKARGYSVLGEHPRVAEVTPEHVSEVRQMVDRYFPPITANEDVIRSRYRPITLRGDVTASQIAIEDRGRF